MRKEKVVLGSEMFDVIHHEPKLTKEEYIQRTKLVGQQLYEIFRDMKEKKNTDPS